MNQPISSEEIAWALFAVIGIAILYFLPPLSRPWFRTQTLPNQSDIAVNEKSGDPWTSMGKITPLHDLDYRTVEPLRVYKFNPKYHLTMGLRKTSINSITHIDNTYRTRLTARRSITTSNPCALSCLDSGVAMLNELYEFLIQVYLPTRYPSIFHLSSSSLTNLVTGGVAPLVAPSERHEAMRIINESVDEDFLLLLPSYSSSFPTTSPVSYSLQALIWAYPVGFTPQSKLGMTLREAHAPVPGYQDKLAGSMDRYFARLTVGDVRERVNWAVAENEELCVKGEYHFYEEGEGGGAETQGREEGSSGEQEEGKSEWKVPVEESWVRCELQTLFALPKTGARVLSVHLYLYPIRDIKEAGLGREMCAAIDGLSKGNVPGFWRYKRAVLWGEKVKEYLMS